MNPPKVMRLMREAAKELREAAEGIDHEFWENALEHWGDAYARVMQLMPAMSHLRYRQVLIGQEKKGRVQNEATGDETKFRDASTNAVRAWLRSASCELLGSDARMGAVNGWDAGVEWLLKRITGTENPWTYIRSDVFTALERRIDRWQKKIPQFAEATRGECVRNMNEEVGELAKAAIDGEGGEALYKEAADLYIALAGMMALEGQSLEAWVAQKMERNEKRVPFIIEKLSARKRGQE